METQFTEKAHRAKKQKKIPFRAKPLAEQVIVITGASSGIGLATAKMAASMGACVVLASRNEEDLQNVVQKIHSRGGQAIYVLADVASYEDVENVRDEALATFGRIDTWINNAGSSIYGFLMDEDITEEQQLFDTNFWGVRHGCRVAVPVMSENGGVIINIGSEVSDQAIPLQGMYSASKQAVKAYSDALRIELEKQNIPVQVCLVRPSSTDTPFTEHALNNLKDGAPSLPSPAYHPDIVAEEILKCATHPKRDVYVGTSKFNSIFDSLFPRRADRSMKSLFKEQTRGAAVPHTEENEGLMHPPLREGRVRGGHRGKILHKQTYKQHRIRNNLFKVLAAGIVLWLFPKTLQAIRSHR